MTIKVLVVDDSALIRQILSEIIKSEPDMALVGAAPDAFVAKKAGSRKVARCYYA